MEIKQITIFTVIAVIAILLVSNTESIPVAVAEMDNLHAPIKSMDNSDNNIAAPLKEGQREGRFYGWGWPGAIMPPYGGGIIGGGSSSASASASASSSSTGSRMYGRK